ncbi:MAG: GntR family transcriptional regulator [Burkholderiales bacterium]
MPKRSGPGTGKGANVGVRRFPEAEAGEPRGEHVYAALREAIRVGELKPGQRLVEREVAATLGVSRTPVRQAFKLLEAQGIASVAGARGLVITALTPEEVRELYTIWESLEGIVARYAAQHATDLDLKALRHIEEQWKSASGPQVYGQLNKQFHDALYRAAHNRYLVRALNAIDDALALLGVTTFSIPGRPAEAGREHAAIVAAIARRDGAAAQQAAEAHIHRAGELRMTLVMGLELRT